MPPNGLYPMPRHHLYGDMSTAPRPKFNTSDFDQAGSSAATVIDEAARTVNDLSKSERKIQKKKEKEKKKARTSAAEASDKTLKTAASMPNMRDQSAAPEAIKSKSKKRRQSDGASEHTPTKKRKRESTVSQAMSPSKPVTSVPSGFVAGTADWLQDLKTSMGDIGSNFLRTSEAGPRGSPTKRGVKAPKREQKKEQAEAEKTPEGKARHGRAKSHNTPAAASAKREDPAESQKMPATTDKAQKRRSKSDSDKSARKTVAITNSTAESVHELPYISTPRHTPIPLPARPVSISRPHAKDKKTARSSEVLVHATPPSKLLQRRSSRDVGTAIPFKLPASATTSGHKKKKKKAPTVLLSSPTSVESNSRGESTSKLGSRTALTSTDLQLYTRPLNEAHTSRVYSQAPAVAISSPSSSTCTASSTHANEAFAGASSTPQEEEEEEEAPTRTFTTLFLASQHTMSFPLEATHLTQHLTRRHASPSAGPPPCLKQATGCSPKGEHMLRLSRASPSPSPLLLNACLVGGGGGGTVQAHDHAALVVAAAAHNGREAETFLANSVRARVPVPRGLVEGVYKLFCPAYAAHHVDRWGFGQRTLRIARWCEGDTADTNTAADKDEQEGDMYTAHLRIPPRTMGYSTAAFAAPPHASFRETKLTTRAEGYVLGIVFLGNGYVLLRADLEMLLRGRKSEGGEGVMEFVGVKEGDEEGRGGALDWSKVLA